PSLQAQQRGDGLQVVLDPVMDLPDRRFLGQQLAFPAAKLGDVAQQDERTCTTVPYPSISVSRGARPLVTSISDSSTGAPVAASCAVAPPSSVPIRSRSEEHTSELQSPVPLVCRL